MAQSFSFFTNKAVYYSILTFLNGYDVKTVFLQHSKKSATYTLKIFHEK